MMSYTATGYTIIGNNCDSLAESHPINQCHVNTIRASNTTWIAHDVEMNPLAHMTRDQLRALTGTILSDSSTFATTSSVVDTGNNTTLPESFDPR